MNIKIGSREVGSNQPVFFIADIAANHCGELSIAKELVHACAESGVDAVKMQNFSASTIVSDYGFKNLAEVNTHQSGWKQPVFDSYAAAAIPLSWTVELKELCAKLEVEYFTSPYSIDLIEAVAPYVSAFKLGSGDITWLEEIEAMCSYDVPVLIATGASDMVEVEAAMEVALRHTSDVLLMQCNTEYTANKTESREDQLNRYRHINIKVLQTYRNRWVDVPLGLSDHTHGCMTVLGAVGLFDCCAVEKHFTFDNTREGQDHSFSMTPDSWQEMVTQTRELKEELFASKATSYEDRLKIVRKRVDDPRALELAIGDGVKRVEANEANTVIVQRRALRYMRPLVAGTIIGKDHIFPLRPCPKEAVSPDRVGEVIGKRLTKDVVEGSHILISDLQTVE